MLSNLRKQNTRRLAKLRNAGPPQVAGWPGSPLGGQRQSEAFSERQAWGSTTDA
jgi:hypothetical protein